MPEREGASSRGWPALPSLCRCRDDAFHRAEERLPVRSGKLCPKCVPSTLTHSPSASTRT